MSTVVSNLSAPASTQAHIEAQTRRLVALGIRVLLLACLPIAAWLALAPLASAVVAPGVVKVEHNRSPVQHAQGGTVREVLVRDGQIVQAGEPMLVLGDVSVDADMQRWDARVRAEQASVARLEAEQALAAQMAMPRDLLAKAAEDRGLAELIGKERALFESRRAGLLSQTALLREQRARILQEKVALHAQIERAQQSMKHQDADLATHRKLLEDGFISATRVSQLEAQVADYGVKLEERRSELARAEQRLVDTELRIKALESEYRQQASDQLKVTLARLAEIQQEQRKTGDAASRQIIRAPATGEVISLKVTTPGTVIGAQDVVAEIVPSSQRLVVEAQLRPEDIERVQRGQSADIRFTAFSYRTTTLVPGAVTYVSADRIVDRQAGVSYYTAQVEVAAKDLESAGQLRLQAGMPAEVYIKGAERTPLQYLIEPVSTILSRAGRER